jgi:hypothetical protein
MVEKKQILLQALSKLNNFVGAEKGLSTDERFYTLDGRYSRDNSDASIRCGESDLTYNIFVQPWAPQKDINTLISQFKALPSKTILFADFINPVMAEKFRRHSIPFADCAGNLFIKDSQCNYSVKGIKLSNLRHKRVRGRAFNAAGLKLIFAIFNQPEFLRASYRDISNKVNIALGSVGPVIDDLYASGYILDEGERRLVNKKRLFERWVDGYLEKLRPKQILACYTCDDEEWWKTAKPGDFHGVWGGEVAVASATPFMIPETISLYFTSDVKQKEFAEHHGLRKDDDGEICIYKSFWSPVYAGDENDDGLSPMIIYADIVDSISPGSWDVAKTFYGEAITDLLQE